MDVERPADLDLARRARVYAALGDPHRLRIVDLLSTSDLTSSELAADLGIGTNLVAHHLRVLEEAEVVESLRSEGDGRRRYLRLVSGIRTDPPPGRGELVTDRVLFVCTGNSARSQLAAAMWNRVSEVRAESAGTHPAAEVHPRAVSAGLRVGVDLTSARPRSIDDIDGRPGLVVTVCDRAHEELASLAEETKVLHWWIPDPRAVGSSSAFDDSIRQLRGRIDTLSPRVAFAERRRARRSTRPRRHHRSAGTIDR